MYSKQELIKKCWKQGWFKNDSSINLMYGTPDGQFFYEKDKNHADNHARQSKQELITITRYDMDKISAFWLLFARTNQFFRMAASFLSPRHLISKTTSWTKANAMIIGIVISSLILLVSFLNYLKYPR